FEPGDVKVQCYAATSTIAEQIFTIVLANELDITDREAGYNIVVTKFGNKDRLKTRYTVTPELKPTQAPIPSNFELPDLSAVGAVKEYGEMLKLLSEGAGEKFKGFLPSGSSPTPVVPEPDTDVNPDWGLGGGDD